MFREYRYLPLFGAVSQIYEEMARPHSIQIVRTGTRRHSEDVLRDNTKQFATRGVNFPLPHRVDSAKRGGKASAKTFSASRPTTYLTTWLYNFNTFYY